jgi:uncharacterized protein YfcZ (UPF0381/DUF406 family)
MTFPLELCPLYRDVVETLFFYSSHTKEESMTDLSNRARQAASKPEFVAHRIAAYQQEKHLDDTAKAGSTRLFSG